MSPLSSIHIKTSSDDPQSKYLRTLQSRFSVSLQTSLVSLSSEAHLSTVVDKTLQLCPFKVNFMFQQGNTQIFWNERTIGKFKEGISLCTQNVLNNEFKTEFQGTGVFFDHARFKAIDWSFDRILSTWGGRRLDTPKSVSVVFEGQAIFIKPPVPSLGRTKSIMSLGFSDHNADFSINQCLKSKGIETVVHIEHLDAAFFSDGCGVPFDPQCQAGMVATHSKVYSWATVIITVCAAFLMGSASAVAFLLCRRKRNKKYRSNTQVSEQHKGDKESNDVVHVDTLNILDTKDPPIVNKMELYDSDSPTAKVSEDADGISEFPFDEPAGGATHVFEDWWKEQQEREPHQCEEWKDLENAAPGKGEPRTQIRSLCWQERKCLGEIKQSGSDDVGDELDCNAIGNCRAGCLAPSQESGGDDLRNLVPDQNNRVNDEKEESEQGKVQVIGLGPNETKEERQVKPRTLGFGLYGARSIQNKSSMAKKFEDSVHASKGRKISEVCTVSSDSLAYSSSTASSDSSPSTLSTTW